MKRRGVGLRENGETGTSPGLGVFRIVHTLGDSTIEMNDSI